MANFGALGTLRHAYRTLNKPSTSALVRSVSVNKNFRNSRNQTHVIASKLDTSKSSGVVWRGVLHSRKPRPSNRQGQHSPIATWYATQNKTGLPTSNADSESELAVNSD